MSTKNRFIRCNSSFEIKKEMFEKNPSKTMQFKDFKIKLNVTRLVYFDIYIYIYEEERRKKNSLNYSSGEKKRQQSRTKN